MLYTPKLILNRHSISKSDSAQPAWSRCSRASPWGHGEEKAKRTSTGIDQLRLVQVVAIDYLPKLQVVTRLYQRKNGLVSGP